MDKLSPTIIYCHGCRSEILISPRKDITELHRVIKENGKWTTVLEGCFKEGIPRDICPFSGCKSSHIQTMRQETKLQRLLAQLYEEGEK